MRDTRYTNVVLYPRMAKRKTLPVRVAKDERMIIKLDARKVEDKVRKTPPPPTQSHRDKTKYRRKPKHPAREDAS